jgi:aldehyde dehydrogenase (NAD+)
MNFELLKSQQIEFIKSGKLLSIDYRIELLNQLKSNIKSLESEILKALHDDFGKSEFEAYSSEIGFIYQDINETIKHIGKWSKPVRMRTALSLFPSSAKIYSQPYGRVFIIAPWNYPFQLLIAPLIAAISGGNTALLKPSELTPKVSAILNKLISQTFPNEIVALVEGDGIEIVPRAINDYRPDLIFFTGSTAVGRSIAKQAAEHLIPCILELGGKSPCIIDQSADLKVAVKRIAFGKCINAGQTCVAPDYFIVHESIKEAFIKEYKETVDGFYSGNAIESSDFTQIVNDRHFERVEKLLNQTKVLMGGRTDKDKRKIEPTLVEGTLDHPIMQEEIFGPVSPVFTFKNEAEIFDLICS